MSCAGVMTCFHFHDMDRDINKLKKESKDCRDDTANLQNKNHELTLQNTEIKDVVAELRSEVVALSKSLNQLTHLYAKQEVVNAELHARIHELETHCNGSDGGFHNDIV